MWPGMLSAFVIGILKWAYAVGMINSMFEDTGENTRIMTEQWGSIIEAS